jgi:WD40 repeat protein
VKLWDATNLQVLRILKGASWEVWAVAFSPDGRRLAAGSAVKEQGKFISGEVILWDSETGRVIHTIRGHAHRIFGVAFSADGHRLASGSRDGTVKVWNAATGQELDSFRHLPRLGTDEKTAIHSVAFSPDGRLLASASDDYTVKVWDTVQGQEMPPLEGHNNYVYSVAFSQDGRYLASASEDKSAKIWEVATGRRLHDLGGHNQPVTSVTFHPRLSPERLITADAVGTLKIWDAATGQELGTLKGHAKQVWGLAFSPDGHRLASASADDTVKIRDARPLSPEVAVEREAVGLVDFLFAEPLRKDEVRERIRTDPSISEAVRQHALAILEPAVDDPDRFHAASRAILRRPNAADTEYRDALHWAETACGLDPERPDYLATLGAGQYRLGRHQLALATLTRANELSRRTWQEESPMTVAMLALTQHRLGQTDQSQDTLKRLRGLLREYPKNGDDPEIRGYAREAEETIGGKPAGSGN